MNIPLVYSIPDQGYLLFVDLPTRNKRSDEIRTRQEYTSTMNIYGYSGIPMVVDSGSYDFIVASANCIDQNDCADNTYTSLPTYKQSGGNGKRPQHLSQPPTGGYEPQNSENAIYLRSKDMNMISLNVKVDVYADKPLIPQLQRPHDKNEHSSEAFHVKWAPVPYSIRVGAAQDMKGTDSNIFGLGMVRLMEKYRQRRQQRSGSSALRALSSTRESSTHAHGNFSGRRGNVEEPVKSSNNKEGLDVPPILSHNQLKECTPRNVEKNEMREHRGSQRTGALSLDSSSSSSYSPSISSSSDFNTSPGKKHHTSPSPHDSSSSSYSSSSSSSSTSLGEALYGRADHPSPFPRHYERHDTGKPTNPYLDLPVPKDISTSRDILTAKGDHSINLGNYMQHSGSIRSGARPFSPDEASLVAPTSYMEYTFAEGQMSPYASMMVPYEQGHQARDDLAHSHYLFFNQLPRDTYDAMSTQLRNKRIQNYPSYVVDNVPLRSKHEATERQGEHDNPARPTRVQEDSAHRPTSTTTYDNAVDALLQTVSSKNVVWGIHVGRLREGDSGLLYIGKRTFPSRKEQKTEGSSFQGVRIPFPPDLHNNFNYMVEVSAIWINHRPVRFQVPRYCMIDTGALQTHFPPTSRAALSEHLPITEGEKNTRYVNRSQSGPFSLTIEFSNGSRFTFPSPSEQDDNGLYDRILRVEKPQLNDYVAGKGSAMVIGIQWIQHMTVEYDVSRQTLGITHSGF
jgi:hypothetical protein